MENKFSLKTVIRIALVLMLVSGLSAALIIALNKVTAPIIVQNNIDKENNSLAQIYAGAEFETLEEGNGTILKVAKATKNNELLGYVYKVTGKNAYGTITLLVGVTNGEVVKVVFLENSESFASKVEDHVNSAYAPNKVNTENVADVDTKCGATYGAKTVKEMISQALEHYSNMTNGGNE